MKWQKTFKGNSILQGNDFYISFRPKSNLFKKHETALCNEKTGKFFVLMADFRKEYEQLIEKGFDVCYDFYLSKKDEYPLKLSFRDIVQQTLFANTPAEKVED